MHSIVVAYHGDVLRHDSPHLFMQHVLVLVAALRNQAVIQLLLTLGFLFKDSRTIRAVALNVLSPFNCSGRGDKSAKDATDQRISAEAIRAMNRIVALTGRK